MALTPSCAATSSVWDEVVDSTSLAGAFSSLNDIEGEEGGGGYDGGGGRRGRGNVRTRDPCSFFAGPLYALRVPLDLTISQPNKWHGRRLSSSDKPIMLVEEVVAYLVVQIISE